MLSFDRRPGDDLSIPTVHQSLHSSIIVHVFHECLTIPDMLRSALVSGQPVGSLMCPPTIPESYVIFNIQEISQHLQTV